MEISIFRDNTGWGYKNSVIVNRVKIYEWKKIVPHFCDNDWWTAKVHFICAKWGIYAVYMFTHMEINSFMYIIVTVLLS